MAYDVFISYASEDKTVADAACAALEVQRIRCWVAPRDVLAGTEYPEAIVRALEDCRAMVLVFSAHANASPHIRREVERAVSKGMIILPLRIEEIAPSKAMEYCLGNTHWLDALTPPLEAHLARLTETVTLLLKGERSPPPSTPAAVSPVHQAEQPDEGFEYRSEWELFGFPLLHICMNRPAVEGRRPGARGVIAIGDSPRGVIAIGTFATGVVAFGAIAMGIMPVGFVTFGIFPVGAIALGLVAGYGCFCIAPIAAGFISIGYYVAGVFALGNHLLTPTSSDPQAAELFRSWLRPWFHVLMIGLIFLSYLLPRAARGWMQSVLAAGKQRRKRIR